MDENDFHLLARLGVDGAAWAREFSETAFRVATREGVSVESLIHDCEPGEWLHGWFCNAIEAGRSAGASA